METNLFDYYLPPELVAQYPRKKREDSRMLVLDRHTGHVSHSWIQDLPQWLLPGDRLVFNQTRVIPARIFARKHTGAKLEILLLRPVFEKDNQDWEVLIQPAKRIKGALELTLENGKKIQVIDSLGEGHFIVNFNQVGSLKKFLNQYGHVPLPPYIRRSDNVEDRERYQSVFAKQEGSLAAPTASLHFSKGLLSHLNRAGIKSTRLTLHVGLGTFLPVMAENIEDHLMHPEWFELSLKTVSDIQKTQKAHQRIVAVGTTVVRALESACIVGNGTLVPYMGETRIFITPGFNFKITEALITNFHQPASTLLMLVSALAGRERILAVYEQAMKEKYRFLSYGDCMLIL